MKNAEASSVLASALEIFLLMCYINLRLLTYLLGPLRMPTGMKRKGGESGVAALFYSPVDFTDASY